MKKKALILFLVTLTATALLFTGCKNKETETTPVTEETVEEIEPTEPVEEATDQQDGLNEGQVIDRGDTTTVDSGSDSDTSISGTDSKTDAEIQEELEAMEPESNPKDTNSEGYYIGDEYYATEEEYNDAIFQNLREQYGDQFMEPGEKVEFYTPSN